MTQRLELQRLIAEGQTIKDLAQHPGWQLVKGEVDRIQRETFEAFLGTDLVKDKDRLEKLQTQARAVKEVMENLERKVQDGIDAAAELDQLTSADREDEGRRVAEALRFEEEARLRAPMSLPQ
jgi:hypothetical protein